MRSHSGGREPESAPGFSLLELMMVLTLILLAATITQPIYQNMIPRGRGLRASSKMARYVISSRTTWGRRE